MLGPPATGGDREKRGPSRDREQVPPGHQADLGLVRGIQAVGRAVARGGEAGARERGQEVGGPRGDHSETQAELESASQSS